MASAIGNRRTGAGFVSVEFHGAEGREDHFARECGPLFFTGTGWGFDRPRAGFGGCALLVV